tara:strand:- start:2805 stop:3443 length:639 start_codon:yes stop_codon:yes gene_type:complete
MKPKKCALVSTPRAGTHYLRMSLDNHPKMRWAGEFFRNCISISKSYDRIKSYIYNGSYSTGIDDFDWVGFVWHLSLKSDLPLLNVDKFILLKRRNVLDQFLSLMIAIKTQKWVMTISQETIELNLAELEHFIEEQEKMYDDFKKWGVEYKTVFYEDLCDQFDYTTSSIQRYLGLDYCRLEPAELIKQETRPISDILSNYEEVKWTLKNMNLL